MSEKREPGWYGVRLRDGTEDVVLVKPSGFVKLEGSNPSYLAVNLPIAELGPSLLPDPSLVQVDRRELELLRTIENRLRQSDFRMRPNSVIERCLDRLDSLRQAAGHEKPK